MTNTPIAAKLATALRNSERELQACQAVIHLRGGFDPAYVEGAKKSLKETCEALRAYDTAKVAEPPSAAMEPGRMLTASHQIITPTCRANRGIDGAFIEAMRRIERMYLDCAAGQPDVNWHIKLIREGNYTQPPTVAPEAQEG